MPKSLLHLSEWSLTAVVPVVVEHEEAARVPDQDVLLVDVGREVVVVFLELWQHVDIAEVC